MSTPAAKIKVKCSCGAALAVSPGRAGTTVICPKCARQVAIPAAGGPHWYVAQSKQKLGPYSAAQMRQMAGAGQLRPEDMVLCEGQKQWREAGSVAGLFPATAAPAAPGRRGSPRLLVGVTAVVLLATCVGGGLFLARKLLAPPAETSPEQAKVPAGDGKDASGKPAPAGPGTGRKDDTPKRALDLKYVPAGASAAVVVHPRRILQAPLVAAALPPGAAAEMVKELGVKPEQIEQMIVFLQVGAPAGPAAPSPPKDTWVELSPKEGRFSVRFPVKPKQSERKTTLGTRQVFTAETQDGNLTFEVSYIDFPRDSPIIGDLARVDFATRALEFKIGFKDKKDIKLGKHLGAEVVIDDKQLRTYSVHRAYVVGDRLYHLEATARKAQKPTADFARFFNSFKVTAAGSGAALPPDLLPLPGAIVRFAEPVDGKQILAKLLKGLREVRYQNQVYYVAPDEDGPFGPPLAGQAADNRTLLLAPESVLRKMLTATAEKSPLLDRLRQADAGDELTAVIFLGPYRKLANLLVKPNQALLPPPLADAAALPDRLDWLSLTVNLRDKALARLTFETDNEKSALAVEKLVQSGLTLLRQAYPEVRGALVRQLPPASVPALIRVPDQLYGGIHVSRTAARVIVTLDRPPAPDLPEGLIAAAGFNDGRGMNSDPVPGSPYPLDTPNREGGSGEPGWAGPWGDLAVGRLAHPAATFQTKVVFEGDGALHLTGSAVWGPNYGRQLLQAQRGKFQLEYRLQVPAGSSCEAYVWQGTRPGAMLAGPTWRAGDRKFSARGVPDTGFKCEPGRWYKVTLRLDVPGQTWEFFVDGRRLESSRPLRFEAKVEYLDYISFRVAGGVYIDALRVTRLPSIDR